jgi:hypothetical protein
VGSFLEEMGKMADIDLSLSPGADNDEMKSEVQVGSFLLLLLLFRNLS